MKKSYSERQAAFITAYDIVVGSKLKVIKTFPDHTDGWSNVWNDRMTKNVGKTLTVESDDYDAYGIKMDDLYYPFYVLQHVSNPGSPTSVRVRLNDSYTAVVGKDKIVVGCQSFKTDIVKKLQNALDELNADDLIAERPRKPQTKKKVKSKRKK